MQHILIDSDVILDFMMDRQPYCRNAALLFDMCDKNQIIGYTTPVIVANSYYLLRKLIPHDEVIEKLIALFQFVEIIQMDKTVVLQALHSDFKNFEDALQNFSGLAHGKITIIITRNYKDYKRSKLSILTPQEFIKTHQLESGS